MILKFRSSLENIAPLILSVFLLSFPLSFFSLNHLYPRGDAAEYVHHAYKLYLTLMGQESDFFSFYKPTHFPSFLLPALVLTKGKVQFSVTVTLLGFYLLTWFYLYLLLSCFIPRQSSRFISFIFLGTLPWMMTSGMVYMTEVPLLAFCLGSLYHFLNLETASIKHHFFFFLYLLLALILRPILCIVYFIIPLALGIFFYKKWPLFWATRSHGRLSIISSLFIVGIWVFCFGSQIGRHLYWALFDDNILLSNPINQITLLQFGKRIFWDVGGLSLLVPVLLALFGRRQKLCELSLFSLSSFGLYLLGAFISYNRDHRLAFIPFFFVLLWATIKMLNVGRLMQVTLLLLTLLNLRSLVLLIWGVNILGLRPITPTTPPGSVILPMHIGREGLSPEYHLPYQKGPDPIDHVYNQFNSVGASEKPKLKLGLLYSHLHHLPFPELESIFSLELYFNERLANQSIQFVALSLSGEWPKDLDMILWGPFEEDKFVFPNVLVLEELLDKNFPQKNHLKNLSLRSTNSKKWHYKLYSRKKPKS